MVKKPRTQTTLSPREEADHYRSVHDYPWLDIEEGEYVVIDIRRTVFGKVFIWLGSIGLTLIFMAIALVVIFTDDVYGIQILSGTLMFCALVSFTVGCLLRWIYGRCYLIISNRRVFERAQTSLFSYRRQSIKLSKIEDVSFDQSGALPLLFNYGTIRMSTVGDEHTYKLTFVAKPAEQIRLVKKMAHGNRATYTQYNQDSKK